MANIDLNQLEKVADTVARASLSIHRRRGIGGSAVALNANTLKQLAEALDTARNIAKNADVSDNTVYALISSMASGMTYKEEDAPKPVVTKAVPPKK